MITNIYTVLILITVIFSVKYIYGEDEIPAWQQQTEQKPDFKCLSYSDGHLSVLDYNTRPCDVETYYKELSWFIGKGYIIGACGDEQCYKVYLTRK